MIFGRLRIGEEVQIRGIPEGTAPLATGNLVDHTERFELPYKLICRWKGNLQTILHRIDVDDGSLKQEVEQTEGICA